MKHQIRLTPDQHEALTGCILLDLEACEEYISFESFYRDYKGEEHDAAMEKANHYHHLAGALEAIAAPPAMIERTRFIESCWAEIAAAHVSALEPVNAEAQ